VSITDGALTLAADRQSLSAVLGAISSRTKIPIVVSDSLADARVSIALRAVPLEEGLRGLLAPYDAFYFLSADDGKAASIRTIWVFARGEGHDLEPVPPAVWGSTKELETQLDNTDPGIRSETIEALIERLGDRGLPTVLRGLSDPDEGVRLATLSAAADAGIEIPANDLHTVVLTDQSQPVRLAALEELSSRPEAEAVARSLRDDVDLVVRNRARQMLGEQEIGGPKQQPR
jgi:HEAT repeat protein